MLLELKNYPSNAILRLIYCVMGFLTMIEAILCAQFIPLHRSVKAFFLRQLLPNTKYINHVLSCFASGTQKLASLYKLEACITCNRRYVYTTYIYFTTRALFSYCYWQFPPHLQRLVHTRLAFTHLHLPLYAVLHPQRISSYQVSFCLFKSRPIRWPATFLTLPSPVCRDRKCGLAQEGLAPSMSSLKYCLSDVLFKHCLSWQYAVKFLWFLAE